MTAKPEGMGGLLRLALATMSGRIEALGIDLRVARPDTTLARLRFREGDRVRYKPRGWIGTVTAERSETAIAWCTFDDIGQFGADPRKLEKMNTRTSSPGDME